MTKRVVREKRFVWYTHVSNIELYDLSGRVVMDFNPGSGFSAYYKKSFQTLIESV